jgi:hypothetical protein
MNIWFICTTNDAHDDIVTISVYGKGDTPLISFKPTGKNQGLLCTLDKCGKQIKTIKQLLIKLILQLTTLITIPQIKHIQ